MKPITVVNPWPSARISVSADSVPAARRPRSVRIPKRRSGPTERERERERNGHASQTQFPPDRTRTTSGHPKSIDPLPNGHGLVPTSLPHQYMESLTLRTALTSTDEPRRGLGHANGGPRRRPGGSQDRRGRNGIAGLRVGPAIRAEPGKAAIYRFKKPGISEMRAFAFKWRR